MLDGVVSGIERVGIELGVGPVQVIIPHTKMPSNLIYNEQSNSFVFKNNELKTVNMGDLVRFKIEHLSIKGGVGKNVINVIGTIDQDYLGLVN